MHNFEQENKMDMTALQNEATQTVSFQSVSFRFRTSRTFRKFRAFSYVFERFWTFSDVFERFRAFGVSRVHGKLLDAAISTVQVL